MSDATVEFRVLAAMFEAMQRSKSSVEKRKKFRKFIDHCFFSRHYFSAIRLILPSLDRERGTYGLKESVLATSLVDALGMSRESEDALRLVNWRKGGAKTGANVGNFALVAAEVLQRRQGLTSGGLTIKELNDLLDKLASSENRGEKTSVLADLIKKTNAREMKWIVMIILKDLKLGISEKSVFHEFHPDAEDLFNVTCDLKLVCEKLKDRTQRHKRQDIEVGKAVRPQLALRVSDATTAWKKLHGKQVVVECKFDGDRIQLHKNGSEIHFFSRNFIDHPEYGYSMSNIILQNILVDRCILDGEMLVWDKSTNRFAEFGSNQEIAKAAKEGLETDRQLCYVAFDILYVGDTSVIHQSVKERHDLLRKIVKPLKGRLEILVPNGGINENCPLGEPCWSLIAYSVADVERFFKETIENRDEGIVLKDLGSKWEPGDRSGKWLKLKPDYIRAGSDLDVLIIGGYLGSGRHGGEVAQFLVGLAERATLNTYPKRFISFCRVGTGLSDDELETLVSKLKPYFRKNEYPKKAPSFYEVTNNSKERPDFWIDSPDKSVILSITSDIRTIKSTVFAAPYSLRFPRIDRVRYEKPWHGCLDMQSFVELVQSNNGTAQKGIDRGGSQDYKSKHVRSSNKREKKSASMVPSHLIQTDVSNVKGTTHIFTNMMFYFVNVPSSYSLEYFHKMVTENGGSFSMNLNDSVTHCVAAERKGIKYQAAILRGDIIHYSWVLDCCSLKRLLHLQPKYFLFLADSSKKKLQEEMDVYSDSYYWDLDIRDIKQLLCNMDESLDKKSISYYKKKYHLSDKWSLFQDCCMYFYNQVHTGNTEFNVLSELALRRMKLEVLMHGGEVSNDLSCATHLVIYSIAELNVDFDSIYQSFPETQRCLLYGKRLQVVGHQWLEDSLENGNKLQGGSYSLKPLSLEESNNEQSGQGLEIEVHPVSESIGQKNLASPDRGSKRKRGRASQTGSKTAGSQTNARRTGFQPARKTRTRLGNRPPKICGSDSEMSDSSESSRQEGFKLSKHTSQTHGNVEMEKDGKRKRENSKMTKGSATDDARQEESGHLQGIETDEMIRREEKEKAEEVAHIHVEEKNKGPLEKLEMRIDPVQAILLDMIPSLSQKAETDKRGKAVVDKKSDKYPDAMPAKKKVSYKEVADRLLEDW